MEGTEPYVRLALGVAMAAGRAEVDRAVHAAHAVHAVDSTRTIASILRVEFRASNTVHDT